MNIEEEEEEEEKRVVMVLQRSVGCAKKYREMSRENDIFVFLN